MDGCCQGLLDARLNKTVKSRRHEKSNYKEAAKIDKFVVSKLNKQKKIVDVSTAMFESA